MGVTDSDYNSSASYLPAYLVRRPEGADLRAELLTCVTHLSSLAFTGWPATLCPFGLVLRLAT